MSEPETNQLIRIVSEHWVTAMSAIAAAVGGFVGGLRWRTEREDKITEHEFEQQDRLDKRRARFDERIDQEMERLRKDNREIRDKLDECERECQSRDKRILTLERLAGVVQNQDPDQQ